MPLFFPGTPNSPLLLEPQVNTDLSAVPFLVSSSTLALMGIGSESRVAADYRAKVLSTPNLLNYWRMDEPVGVTSVDAKAVSNGTYGGTVTLGATGAVAGDAAISVAGAGSWSAPINLSAFNQITVEFWLNWTTFANDDAMGVENTADGGSNNGGFFILPNSSGTTLFDVLLHEGVKNIKAGYTRQGAGAYHHYAIPMDRTAATAASACKLYYDGVLQTPSFIFEVDGAVGGTFANSTMNAMARNASSLFATGSIDELAIYSGLLSEDTIRNHAAG